MDGFNKVISFVLGLVVIVVLVAIITGRLNLRERFLSISRGQTATKTPTPTRPPSSIPTPTDTVNFTNDASSQMRNEQQTIPNTGSPTEVLMLSVGILTAGAFLRKAGTSMK